MNSHLPKGLELGLSALKTHTKGLPETPGVYLFLNAKGEILYVGKAKRLKRRVHSYVKWEGLPIRKQRMVAQIHRIEVQHTTTETEALLLETNLIKKHRPPYNILMKDDKSFPFIRLTGEHDFPRLMTYRGSRKEPGEYYGPFASKYAIYESFETLQRVFQLRTCSDHVFANRSRPCLLYHIKRCSGPCVGKITQEAYKERLASTKKFFKGQTRNLQETLAQEMRRASAEQAYEKAAILRDRIKSLTRIQEHQVINLSGRPQDFHVHALAHQGNKVCIQVAFYQTGQHFGSKAYFPAHVGDETPPSEVLANFLMQFYTRHVPPKLILTNILPDYLDLLEAGLSALDEEKEKAKVKVATPKQGPKLDVVTLALHNAQQSLLENLKDHTSHAKGLSALQELLGLDAPLKRVEAYDNSHFMGKEPYGVMVVADENGFLKSGYRRFKINPNFENRGIKTNDDYAMMDQVMKRRFKAPVDQALPQDWPDVALIDGGVGQLGRVQAFFNTLDPGLPKPVLVGISKGENRNAGEETLHFEDGTKVKLPKNDQLLFFLQRLRDESHRFAITSHRKGRAKKLTRSVLDSLEGIGAKRKKALLNHFGSAADVARAPAKDIANVEGISPALAQKIYDHFHG